MSQTGRKDPLAGLAFGRYQPLRALARGGMGEVFLSRMSGAAGFEKLCVVKTILPRLVGEADFLERFRHEAKLLVHLQHANIAQIYDMGEGNDTLFMALEYVPGVDLARIQKHAEEASREIPIAVAISIGQRIADALAYAHRKTDPEGHNLGIVHRDVSPHNVLVSFEGEVKVIDFGIAKSLTKSNLTIPSTVIGKAGYMSPEQAMGEPLDYRTDIYSCGLILYELIAGHRVFRASNIADMMMSMAEPEVPPLRQERAEVSPELNAVVMKALSPNKGDRHARAEDLVSELAEVAYQYRPIVSADRIATFIQEVCPAEFKANADQAAQFSGPHFADAETQPPDVRSGSRHKKQEMRAGTFQPLNPQPEAAVSPPAIAAAVTAPPKSVRTPSKGPTEPAIELMETRMSPQREKRLREDPTDAVAVIADEAESETSDEPESETGEVAQETSVTPPDERPAPAAAAGSGTPKSSKFPVLVATAFAVAVVGGVGIGALRDQPAEKDVVQIPLPPPSEKAVSVPSSSDSTVPHREAPAPALTPVELRKPPEEPHASPDAKVPRGGAETPRGHTRSVAPAAKAGGAHGFGSLSLTCRPDCDVEIDNQESHHAPLVKLKLPAGPHRLRMVNRMLNLSTTDTIQVEPDGSLVRSYNLVMDVRGH